jgi:predicted AAA+ superfamily ATPase
MITQPPIRHLVGLNDELSSLEDRIQNLCENRAGGTILISAPKGRGKSLLWKVALENAKKGSAAVPQVVSLDLENAPKTYEELANDN